MNKKKIVIVNVQILINQFVLNTGCFMSRSKVHTFYKQNHLITTLLSFEKKNNAFLLYTVTN